MTVKNTNEKFRFPHTKDENGCNALLVNIKTRVETTHEFIEDCEYEDYTNDEKKEGEKQGDP